jgi:hypothetical protein
MDFSKTIRYAISGAAGLALLTSAGVLAEADPQKPAAKQTPKVDEAAQQPQAKRAPQTDEVAQQPQTKQIPQVKEATPEKQALRSEQTQPAAQKQKVQKKASAAQAMPQKKLSAKQEPKKAVPAKMAAPVKQAVKQQPAIKATQGKAAAPIKQEAKAQPEKELAQQQTEKEQGLRVSKIVLAKDIDEGQPIEPGASFSQDDGRVFALIYVDNPNREETTVRVSWQREDGPHWRGFPLEIPAVSTYRTVARTMTSTREPGIYKCVVSDDSGVVLDFAEFKISE